MLRTALTDTQWALVAPLCPGRDCDPGRIGPDPRLFVESVLWIVRAGSPWRDLPAVFRKWNSVFRRLRRWAKADAFYHMFKALACDADFEYAMISGSNRYGQVTKRGAQSQAIGRSREGMTTKIMVRTDALGKLTDFRLLSPPQAHDLRGTAELIDVLDCGQFRADRAFDASWLREALTHKGIEAVIPPKSNRRFPAEFDRDNDKWRHLTVNFFEEL